jgi:hypothetical protein
VWEYPPQRHTLSLEAGRDDWLVAELAAANRASHNLSEAAAASAVVRDQRSRARARRRRRTQ